MLACGPAGIDTNETESTADDMTSEGGESCMASSPAVEVSVVEGEGGATECVVTLIERDEADDRLWRLGLECGTNDIDAELILEPALEQLPLELGQQVAAIRSIGPDVELLQILEYATEHPVPLLVAMLDFRSPSENPDDHDMLPGFVQFDWTIAPGCTGSDPECGVVEARQVDVYLYTSVNPEVVTLGSDEPYGVISDETDRFGIWLGENWYSDCGGDPTVQVTYAVVALP